MSAGSYSQKLVCVRRSAREARIHDDHVGAIEFLALQDVLQRNWVRLGRVSAHDHEGSGNANIVETIGHRAVAPGVGDAGDGG